MNWRARYRIVHIEHDGHYLYIENQARGKTQSCNVKDVVHEPTVELWNVDTQFGRGGKFINHPSYHHLSQNLAKIHHSLTFNTTFSQSISNRNDNQSKARQTPVQWKSILFQPVLKAYPT